MATIRRITPPVPQLPKRKRVAAYARVSLETDRLLNSLSAQVSYYSNFIQSNPAWEYAGVYADSGISGTSTAKRAEFQRLIADCEAGLIDIVLTKSISRFARNTVDLLETVRHLKDLGVEVRFEEQGINTMTGDGELMLTILASFAQEEIKSLSDSQKWAIRKRFAQGIPNGKPPLYGYTWDGDQLVVVPAEAEVVRRIFANFVAGKSRLETSRELAADNITTRNGVGFCDRTLGQILENVHYTGNLLLQKEYVADPINRKKVTNNGELPQYYVSNHHEAIIDQATFDYVQAERQRRRDLGFYANKSINLTCFSGKIRCGACGLSFIRRTRKSRAKTPNPDVRIVSWSCGSRYRKGGVCGGVSTGIPERILKPICAEVMGLPEFDEDAFTQLVDHITVPANYQMTFHLTNGTTIKRTWQNDIQRGNSPWRKP